MTQAERNALANIDAADKNLRYCLKAKRSMVPAALERKFAALDFYRRHWPV